MASSKRNKAQRNSVYMKQALIIAKDMLTHGYLPVGAVLVKGNKVVADSAFYKGEEESLHRLDHAEVVALRRFFERYADADGSKLTLYCTFEPCLMCYSTAIVSGITKIVYAYEDAMGGGTNINLKTLNPFYAKNAVKITPAVCREESLALFQRYFENPDNEYAGTLLEKYTLHF